MEWKSKSGRWITIWTGGWSLAIRKKRKEKVNKKEEGRQEGRRGAFEKGWPAGRPSVKVFETQAERSVNGGRKIPQGVLHERAEGPFSPSSRRSSLPATPHFLIFNRPFRFRALLLDTLLPFFFHPPACRPTAISFQGKVSYRTSREKANCSRIFNLLRIHLTFDQLFSFISMSEESRIYFKSAQNCTIFRDSYRFWRKRIVSLFGNVEELENA